MENPCKQPEYSGLLQGLNCFTMLLLSEIAGGDIVYKSAISVLYKSRKVGKNLKTALQNAVQVCESDTVIRKRNRLQFGTAAAICHLTFIQHTAAAVDYKTEFRKVFLEVSA